MLDVKDLILKKIGEFDSIIIHSHVTPDPDALGSQGGLKDLILSSFPDKKVYIVGEEVEGLKYLTRMEEIKDSIYEGSLVIVCDTANAERISDSRFKLGSYIIKIDHHPDTDSYGDLEWVDTSYSSTCEMLVDLLIYSEGQLKVSSEGASLLYAGIIGDTGRFLYNNTSSRTFECASYLLKYDFSPADIFEPLYKTTAEISRLKGYVLQNYDLSENGVAYIYITKELMDRFSVTYDEASNLVNCLSNIEGNHIWVFFLESEDEIRVRIRSKEVSINDVAKKFNGGGHPLASGATVGTKSDVEDVINSLDNLLI